MKKFLYGLVVFFGIVSSALSMTTVRLGLEYFPQVTASRAVGGGYLYIGESDTDPTVAVNQKVVYALKEDGTTVVIPQPIGLSAGGIPLLSNSPVTLSVDGDYSLKVTTLHGSNVYYVPSTADDNLQGLKLLHKYTSLASAIVDIGATETTLLVDEDVVLTANVTAPKTLTVRVMPGVEISGAFTPTFNGRFYGADNCFGADVTPAFGVGSIDRLLPEWYGTAGDGVNDDFAKMQRAWNSARNIAPVTLGKTYYIPGQLEFPCGGFVLESSISDSYFASGVRSRYHLINGIGADDTKTFLYASVAKVGKGTVTIRNLNINMNDSTSKAVSNEDDADGSRFHIENVLFENCGKHGVWLNNGANTSELKNVIIGGISTADVDLGTGLVAGAWGIYSGASDVKIMGGEVKGRFARGIVLAGEHCLVSGINTDQCNYGGYDYGAYNRWTNNRFQYNYVAGLDLGIDGADPDPCINPTIVGNEFSRNNSVKDLLPGNYDGKGILATNLTGGTITGNTFSRMDYGIWVASASEMTIGFNTGYLLDEKLYDYSANTGATDNYIHENTEESRAVTQTVFRGANKIISHSIVPQGTDPASDVMGGYVETAIGAPGGSIRTYGVHKTVSIPAAASVTFDFNIPSGAYMTFATFVVETALNAADTWDAEWNDGATLQAIVTAGPGAKNTQRYAYFNPFVATPLCDADTDIILKKNGGGNFTATGVITCTAYYEFRSAMNTIP